MNDDDIRLKIQALIDNELPEDEIEPLLDAIEGSYEYRREYVELKKLSRRLKGVMTPEPPQEWIDRLERSLARRSSSLIGKILFIGSYVALVGYAVYRLFGDPSEGLAVKIIVGGIVLGVLALLGVSIADRLVERRTDKYREVMR